MDSGDGGLFPGTFGESQQKTKHGYVGSCLVPSVSQKNACQNISTQNHTMNAATIRRSSTDADEVTSSSSRPDVPLLSLAPSSSSFSFVVPRLPRFISRFKPGMQHRATVNSNGADDGDATGTHG